MAFAIPYEIQPVANKSIEINGSIIIEYCAKCVQMMKRQKKEEKYWRKSFASSITFEIRV